MKFRIERYDDVSSTNNLVKECIDAGDAEGLVVVAKTQNGGYGRRGNAWASPEGGLYMSVLLRPEVSLEDLPTLPHACAIAVRRAIASFLDPEKADLVKIKWPNDIVYTGSIETPEGADFQSSRASFKKMCGISVEQRKGAICVGIGINVARPNNDSVAVSTGVVFSGDGRNTKNVPVYVEDLVASDKMVSMEALEARLLEELDNVYFTWNESLFAGLRNEYLDHFALEGFKARIDDDANTAIECEVVGINDRGNLEVIPLGKTEVKTIAAGTVRAI